jgi:hypothetical protein
LPALAGVPALFELLELFVLFELEAELETPPQAARAAAAASAQQLALSVLYVFLRSMERAPPDTNVVSICGAPASRPMPGAGELLSGGSGAPG